MSVFNQLVNVQINSVATSSQINMGNAVNVNPFYSAKALGGIGSIGDSSANANANSNTYIDPDINSQSNFRGLFF